MRSGRLGTAALSIVMLCLAGFANAAAPVASAPGGPIKPPEITPEQRADGKKAAPALIAAAGLPCQLADARHIGDTTDPKTSKPVKYYEIACTGAMGYVLVDHGAAAPPSWASCPDQEKTDATGKVNGAACFLPANLDNKALLAPFIAQSKAQCDVSNVRGIGHGESASYFEVACANGRGFILKTSAPPKLDQPVQMITCLAFDASSALACKLTTSAAQLAAVDVLAGSAGKSCTVKDKRYILTAADMSNYYEVACTDGKGWVLHEGADGKLAETIGCDAAGGIGGGCTLTNTRDAETEQAGLYTKLARAAGFNCDVSKYSPFNVDVPGHEVVELACKDRSDGAVAIFPASSADKANIYDCAHAELVGYRCSFSTPDQAFGHVTDELKSLGKTSCAVSGERIV